MQAAACIVTEPALSICNFLSGKEIQGFPVDLSSIEIRIF
jgi:hypothetical protein